MGAGPWGNPLLLLAALALVARLGQFQQWSGFQESTSPKNVNSTLAFFLETYNSNGDDSYLFRVDQLPRSQVQLTTGVEYLVTMKMSWTKCKRNSTNNSWCPIHSKKKPQKSFICDFLVYTVPWMNHYQLWNNSCLDA